MRRTLAILPLLVLSIALLVGCGPGGSTKDVDAKPEKVAEKPKDEPEVVTAPAKLATPADGEEVGVFETTEGRIVFVFYPDIAPKHVERFKAMINEGFYDGTRFHRCMPGFMIQGGDPISKDLSSSGMWGTGGYMDADGKEVNIEAEFNDMTHDRAVLSTARSPAGPDTASSQFFIMHADYPSLDGQYTAWGRLVSGIEVVDKIVMTRNGGPNGAVVPASAVVLESASIETWPLD